MANIELPDSIKAIGQGAFYNTAYYNNRANWENNALYIGKHLISSGVYPSLVSGAYSIKPGTLTIADNTFAYNYYVTSITIPDSVTRIGTRVFINCDAMSSVTIPDGVTEIGDYAFSQCSSLKNVTLPDGLTWIGYRAFQSCHSITSLTIPDSVTELDRNAFSTCYSLGSISISKNVKSLSAYVFDNCIALTKVSIPVSVKSIEVGAFNSVPVNTIYYGGSREQWNKVYIDNFYNYNATLQSATIVFNHPAHEYTDPQIIAPSCTEAGYTSYTCSLCGDICYVDETPALGHNFVRGKCSRCGEVDPEFILYGDADGDGEIATKDVTLLRRYIASYDDTTGLSSIEVGEGADANCDGVINSKDVTLLRRYLANYDDTTGTSTVVLGPQG